MKYYTNVNIPKLEAQQNASTTSYLPIKNEVSPKQNGSQT